MPMGRRVGIVETVEILTVDWLIRSYMPKKEVEFVWRGSESIGSASDLLMHLLPWGYEVRSMQQCAVV